MQKENDEASSILEQSNSLEDDIEKNEVSEQAKNFERRY